MKKLLFMLTIPALLFTACSDDEYDLPPNPKLDVNASYVWFNNQAGVKEISVTSNLTWIVESNQDWCVVTPSDGDGDATLRIQVEENTSTSPRSAIILVKADKTILNREFTVHQLDGDPQVTVSPRIKTVNAAGEIFDVDVTYNVDYEIVMPQDNWVIARTPRALSTNKTTFEVFANTTQNSRTAKVIFKHRHSNDASDTLTIQQEGLYDGLLGNAVYHYKSILDNRDYTRNVTISLDNQPNTLLISGILEQPLRATVEINGGDFVLVMNFPQSGGSREITMSDGTRQVVPMRYTPTFYDNLGNVVVTPDAEMQLTARTSRTNLNILFDNQDYGLGEVYRDGNAWMRTELSSVPGTVSITRGR